MTDAERNRRVAEICGYEVACDANAHWVDGDEIYIKSPSVRTPKESEENGWPWRLFDPLHDANQAIEALDRKFPGGYCIDRTGGWWTITESAEDRGFGASGEGESFCQAAVAAIEAAGGKG